MPPPARGDTAIAYDNSQAERVILFGGLGTLDCEKSTTSLEPGTFALDVCTKKWKFRQPIQSPEPITAGQMAYDAKSNRAVLFGGYDKTADAWTPLSSGPAARVRREQHLLEMVILVQSIMRFLIQPKVAWKSGFARRPYQTDHVNASHHPMILARPVSGDQAYRLCIRLVQRRVIQHLPAFPPHRSHDGRPIILIRFVATLLVRSLAGRILGIGVEFTFSPRILEHFVCFRMAIGEGGIRLFEFGAGLDSMAHRQYRLVVQVQLRRQFSGGLTFTDTAHQQDRLPRCPLATLKDRPSVQIVDGAAG